jgi:hypothetical protein
MYANIDIWATPRITITEHNTFCIHFVYLIIFIYVFNQVAVFCYVVAAMDFAVAVWYWQSWIFLPLEIP